MYNLIAQFPRQQVVRDRQYTALLRWSSYVAALPMPTEKPAEQWVKERIISGRVATNTDFYVTSTLSGVAAQPDIQTNIRQHLNAFNDDGVEAAMDSQVDTAMAVVMPAFCRSMVTDAEVNDWYNSNGFAEPAADATLSAVRNPNPY